MPSSTSSSDLVQNSSHGRAPQGNWRGTLLIFIIGFVVLLCGLEGFWRAQGHVPSINDSQNLWAQQRALIEKNSGNPNTTVLLGASRMQLGFDTQYFRKTYPNRPLVNLAIDGATPAAVLKDLAEDENFNGIVIASMKASSLNQDEWGLSQPYVDRYHKDYQNSIDRQLNTSITLWLQEHFVLFQHNLGVRNLLKTLAKGKLPEPFYITTYPDRSRAADYSKMRGLEAHKSERINRLRAIDAEKPPKDFDNWQADVKEVGVWVKKIESRGGQVIFVRFPTSGEHWVIDEKRYPRAQYWDYITELTGVPTLHFQDIQGMSAYELPDTSHLDKKDRESFTILLLDHIKPLLQPSRQ